jgi:hypothetical protein
VTDESLVVAHSPAKYQQRKATGAHELYDKDSFLYKVDRDTIRCLLDSCRTAQGLINREALEKALIQYCADIRHGKVALAPSHDDEGPG